MIHGVEIAFLFMSFKRLRLERELRQILLDLEQLTSDTSFYLQPVSVVGINKNTGINYS